ncbi:glycosyltransferase family 4 protein [Leptospira sp. GIMC2001]|uniref:glycosyltransferase family 4 protein n=1 Tax=Leptospira sp. GIMC2001 TaxID=1513297 RepID=UPI00234B26E4|nr:glycosyltransferase family 1 protein [Leptospira sp. GIMC2001]WCL47897.1 glycosyltransferase family 1 protein [Leptospira sp. GIMC2001]
MKRIGLDARPLSTPMSGVGRLIHETIKAFPDNQNYHFILFSHNPIHESHKEILKLPNIEWRQGQGILSKKGGTFYNIQLPFMIRKENLSLFWGSQQVLPPAIPNKIPCVLTYCDLVLYLYPETMRPLARFQQRLFQKYSVNRSAHILNISESTRRDLIAKFNYPESQTSVAYPGIDPKSINQFLKSKITNRIRDLGDNYILSVSTMEPRKNYPFLLKVFTEIRRKNKNIKWVIAGKRGWESQEFYDELDMQIQEFKDIIVLEGLNDPELHHLYKNCKLFWMASHYEGFGIPLLEALFHKKFCVASDIPTFREIGKDLIVYLSTSKDHSIKDWLDQTNEAIKKNKKVNFPFKEFLWSVGAQKTLEAFEKQWK